MKLGILYRNLLQEVRAKPHDRIKIYEDDKLLVVMPLTHFGAVKYGQNTPWCTSVASNPFWFTSFCDNGMLIYYHDKTTGKKYAQSFNPMGEVTIWGEAKDEMLRQLPVNVPPHVQDRIRELWIEKQKELDDKYAKVAQIKDKLIKGIELSPDETHVPGSLDLRGYRGETLGNLKTVSGYVSLPDAKSLKTLGYLTHVGDNLTLDGAASLESLGALETVRGYLNLDYTRVIDLGNLRTVGSSLSIKKTPLITLSDEEIRSRVNVGGDIYR